MGVHDGHRDRLRDQVLKHGLDTLNDVNVLELVLFYALPRINTNEVAHALLDRFGGLEAVFNASIEELQTVPGVGPPTALFISLFRQLPRRFEINRTRSMKTITSPEDAGAYFLPRLRGETNEKLFLLCLDTQKRMLDCVEIASGSINDVQVSIRKIAETAIKSRASSVILAHNHPDGTARPSKEDELTTRSIANALHLLNIPVVDHIVVGADEYISFAKSGLLNSRGFI